MLDNWQFLPVCALVSAPAEGSLALSISSPLIAVLSRTAALVKRESSAFSLAKVHPLSVELTWTSGGCLRLFWNTESPVSLHWRPLSCIIFFQGTFRLQATHIPFLWKIFWSVETWSRCQPIRKHRRSNVISMQRTAAFDLHFDLTCKLMSQWRSFSVQRRLSLLFASLRYFQKGNVKALRSVGWRENRTVWDTSREMQLETPSQICFAKVTFNWDLWLFRLQKSHLRFKQSSLDLPKIGFWPFFSPANLDARTWKKKENKIAVAKFIEMCDFKENLFPLFSLPVILTCAHGIWKSIIQVSGGTAGPWNIKECFAALFSPPASPRWANRRFFVLLFQLQPPASGNHKSPCDGSIWGADLPPSFLHIAA